MDLSGSAKPRPPRWVGSAFLLAGVFFAAGCAAVREAREAQRGDGRMPGERPVSAREIGLNLEAPLSIEEVVRVALQCHPALIQASQAVVVAKAQIEQSRAGRRPSAEAAAGHSRATANTEARRGRHESGRNTSGALKASWRPFDFGRTAAAERQAVAAALAAEAEYHLTQLEVQHTARQAFYEACRAAALTAVYEEAVRRYAEHLRQTEAFAEVGRRTRYDVTRAKVNLRNAELNLVSQRNEWANARAALCRSMGLSEVPEFAVAPPRLKRREDLANCVWEEVRERHPALAALRAREEAASAGVDAAVAEWRPDLALSAQYGAAGASWPLVWNWSVGAQSVWSLLTGGRREARIRQAVAELRAARARRVDREQALYLEWRRALHRLEAAAQRMEVTDLLVLQAQENLDLALERYRVGQATSLEVTDAQVARTEAEAERLRARFDYQSAVDQAAYAVGEMP